MCDRYLWINDEIQCVDQTIATEAISDGIMVYTRFLVCYSTPITYLAVAEGSVGGEELYIW
jgi:hypothetical protein